MDARKVLVAAGALAWAALLGSPSVTSADKGPFREIGPDVAFEDTRSDPEVPDTGHPHEALKTGYENGSYDVDRNETDKRTRETARLENWYRRILRVLRTLAPGGLAR